MFLVLNCFSQANKKNKEANQEKKVDTSQLKIFITGKFDTLSKKLFDLDKVVTDKILNLEKVIAELKNEKIVAQIKDSLKIYADNIDFLKKSEGQFKDSLKNLRGEIETLKNEKNEATKLKNTELIKLLNKIMLESDFGVLDLNSSLSAEIKTFNSQAKLLKDCAVFLDDETGLNKDYKSWKELKEKLYNLEIDPKLYKQQNESCKILINRFKYFEELAIQFKIFATAIVVMTDKKDKANELDNYDAKISLQQFPYLRQEFSKTYGIGYVPKY